MQEENPLKFLSQNLKPVKLFFKQTKNYNINKFKYNASLIKKKNKINNLRNSNIKIHSLNNGSSLEQNILNKYNSFIEKNTKYFKDNEKNRYSLYSSSKINLKKIL